MLFRKCRIAQIAVLAMLACMSALAQTTVNFVGADYPIGTVTLGGKQFDVSLSVVYPIGLSAGQYIAGTQLITDVMGFFSTYSPPTDAPEAQVSTVAVNLQTKYSQMAGVSLIAAQPPNITATGVTQGATISAVTGTFTGGTIPIIAARPPIAAGAKSTQPKVVNVPVPAPTPKTN